MSALFSLKLWLIFVQRIVNTLYPANILSLFFLYPVRGKIKVNSGMKFILILLAVDLFIRMIAFFSGIPFSHRYLYPMMIIVTIFSGLGMLSFINILWKHLIKRFPALTERGIGVVVLLIVFFSYSGKALHSSNDKKWLKDISLLIKSRIVPGREAAILSNYDESRFVYYSGCGELLLFSPEKDFLIRRHVRYENDSKWRVESEGFDGFNHYLKSSSGQVFIIYRIKKSEIKANTESFFPEVKFIGKFSDNRRKYEYFVFQKNERK
jgi:hypothetical protein